MHASAPARLALLAIAMLQFAAPADAAQFRRPADVDRPRLVILTPGVPLRPSVRVGYDVLDALPVLGRAASSVREDSAGEALAERLERQKLSIAQQLQADLFVTLLQANYAAAPVTVKRGVGVGSTPPSYVRRDQLPADPEAWAYLDVRVVDYGFVSSSSMSDYRATLTVDAVVIDAKSRATLHQQRYAYQAGGRAQAGAVEVTPSVSGPGFGSAAELERQAPKAADALRLAAKDVAQAIADRLR